MNLRELLNLCRADHSDDWARIPPGDHGTDLLAGLFDPVGDGSQVQVFDHTYRAVYEPTPELGIGWGMEAERPEDRHRHGHDVEWGEDAGKTSKLQTTHVLLNGTMVWRTRTVYVNWGSGIGFHMPALRPRFSREELATPELVGWETTRWEVELARLITLLSPTEDSSHIDRVLSRLEVRVADVDPIVADQVGID